MHKNCEGFSTIKNYPYDKRPVLMPAEIRAMGSNLRLPLHCSQNLCTKANNDLSTPQFLKLTKLQNITKRNANAIRFFS